MNMPIYKKTIYEERPSALKTIQYALAILIAILFGAGLIPFTFWSILPYLAGVIILQLIFSTVRFAIINIILELILLVLALLSAIPLLGYIFRILGLILALLEIGTLKSTVISRRVEYVVLNKKSDGSRNGNAKQKEEVKTSVRARKASKSKDAEFSEK